MKIISDEFNSEIFGFKMGNILEAEENVTRTETKEIIRQGKNSGYRHLSIKIPTAYKRALSIFLMEGFRLVDTQILYNIDIQDIMGNSNMLGDVRSIAETVDYQIHSNADTKSIMNISRTAFHLDQFHSNSLLPQDLCDKYYEQWAKNSCEGLADEVRVLSLKDCDRIVGYITLNYGTAYEAISICQTAAVGLAAIDKDYQGRGFFSYLIVKTIEMLANRGIRFVTYGTQLANQPVLNVMGHFGGIPIASNHVLHLML